MAHVREAQIFLAGKLGIECGFCYTRPLDNLVDSCCLIALRVKELTGSSKYSISC